MTDEFENGAKQVGVLMQHVLDKASEPSVAAAVGTGLTVYVISQHCPKENWDRAIAMHIDHLLEGLRLAEAGGFNER